jgi:hypothetical protein
MKSRRRLLAVWAALSTPALLVAAGLLILPLGLSLFGFVLLLAFVLAAIEAAARRELVLFVVTSVGLLFGLSLAIGLVRGLEPNWRLLIAGGLGLVALGFLVVNLVELRRT